MNVPQVTTKDRFVTLKVQLFGPRTVRVWCRYAAAYLALTAFGSALFIHFFAHDWPSTLLDVMLPFILIVAPAGGLYVYGDLLDQRQRAPLLYELLTPGRSTRFGRAAPAARV